MIAIEFSDQDEIDPMMIDEMNFLMDKYLLDFSKYFSEHSSSFFGNSFIISFTYLI